MARLNGGIIGKINQSSFGKCTTTSKTSTSSLTLQSGTRQVQALLVAGGGAGGTVAGGGGGGGGYRCVSNIQVASGCLSVTVGAGVAGAGYNAAPNLGNDTSIATICGETIAAGGGGAGTTLSFSSPAYGEGGSGGGGAYNAQVNYSGNVPPVSPPQGNPGGQGVNNAPGPAGGGGGGAV